jgi:hypothetical protein
MLRLQVRPTCQIFRLSSPLYVTYRVLHAQLRDPEWSTGLQAKKSNTKIKSGLCCIPS